jgi:nicotinamide phosphoribosyltransferase
MNPLLLVDSYKIHHTKMYPEGMTLLYSNFTPRKSRIAGVDKVVVFGLQHFIKEYLIKQFNENFFLTRFREGGIYEDNVTESDVINLKNEIIEEYKRNCPVNTKHIEALWDLGYLPIEVKALSEGTKCPIGVPLLTIKNTHPDFGWLVNYLETLISCQLWQPITSATIANQYYELLTKYAVETTGNSEGVQWQGHDFSMRGMSSVESSILSGMGHLLSFTGTDTIPAIYALERSYNGNGLIGASVPATEHSVMCVGKKESELETFRRLLELYPTGILSVVSDTWNLWDVIKKGGLCDQLKEEILSRDGKLVIRPDSGDPVDIICGTSTTLVPDEAPISRNHKYEAKGVIELLWDLFGGTVNELGYKVLDSHIGAIYGDSITLDRAKNICERLKAKGFASTNIVLGIGSYTYQYNTRDTFGFAMKATYGEITTESSYDTFGIPCVGGVECREIFKDPITDDGTKKSKKGLLCIEKAYSNDGKGNTKEIGLICIDQQTWAQEEQGELKTVFKDGKLVIETTLDEIRNRLKPNEASK